MSIKKELLLVAGYTQEDMAKVDLSNLGSEEVQKMVRDKLLGGTTPNGRKQKVVKADETDKYLSEGWGWKGDRPNGDAILKAPVLDLTFRATPKRCGRTTTRLVSMAK